MIKRVRYTTNEISANRFYQMPKFLFEGEFRSLSNNARILYCLLKDRHELSLKNKWINENNEVYLIYTRKEMQEMLSLGEKTVKKTIEQLKEFGLMEEERMGLNRANRIFLTAVDIEITGPGKCAGPDQEYVRVKNRKKEDSRMVKYAVHDQENMRSSNTDISNTDIKSVSPSEKKKLVMKDGQTDRRKLKKNEEAAVQEIMHRANLTSDPRSWHVIHTALSGLFARSSITVCGQEYNREEIREKLIQKLSQTTAIYALAKFDDEKSKNEIRNPRAYFETVLMSALDEADLHIRDGCLEMPFSQGG